MRARLDFRPAALDLIGVRQHDRNVMRVRIIGCGQPWDTTGATITAQARLTPQAPDPPAIEADVSVVDETQGTYLVRWPGDDIAALLDGAETWEGTWDLQVMFPGETEPESLLAGVFQAESDVTR